jgi:hypothetical protein
MGDVVEDVVVSVEWSRVMLSRDNGGWQSGVGASGQCGDGGGIGRESWRRK